MKETLKLLAYIAFAILVLVLISARVVRAASQDGDALTEETITDQMIELGSEIFNQGTCVKCHLAGGIGGDRAPALTDSEWLHGDGGLESIRAIIRRGVPKDELKDTSRPFEMFPMGGMKLDDEQLAAITAYVWNLSRQSDS